MVQVDTGHILLVESVLPAISIERLSADKKSNINYRLKNKTHRLNMSAQTDSMSSHHSPSVVKDNLDHGTLS